MKRKQVEAKRKLKPITFKFSLKNGGTVMFKGLWANRKSGEYEEMPESIVAVLEQYGFDREGYTMAVDMLTPSDDVNMEEVLESIVDVVSVFIDARSEGVGKRRKPIYEVNIDEADSGVGGSVFDALAKAFVQWNEDGRTIEGVPFGTALTDIVDIINEERKGD